MSTGQLSEVVLGGLSAAEKLELGKREISRTVQQQDVLAGFPFILDFYHAAEHLSTASERMSGKGASEAEHRYKRWRR